MFYTAAWCIKSEDDFKKAIPFELMGKSIQRFGSTLKFNIVILEGINLLSKNYLNSLRNHGFNIIDYCKEFIAIVDRYPSLNGFYVRYERNCLLRWVAFQEICSQNNDSQFWHLDGDVILHTSLDSLAEDTKGKNFMLQGCPVFISISDFEWFELYESALNALNQDILSYSNEAFKMKEVNKGNDLKLVNDSLYRNPIGSDQDLLEYLISAKKLPQDTIEKIFDSKYYFMQNPLSLKKWNALQIEKGHFSQDQHGKILIGSKEVPFIHYQGTFANYAKIYLLLTFFLIPDQISKTLIKYRIVEDKFETSIVFKLLYKVSKNFQRDMSRSKLIETVMKPNRNTEPLIIRMLNFLLA